MTNERRVVIARFAGYLGVSINGLLVPVLVWGLTGSPGMAGLAIAMEWIPKLGLYLCGGSVVSWLGAGRAHVGLEITRLVCLTILLAGTIGLAGFWMIVIAATLFQCANAVSNILFECLVTANWHERRRSSGHASIVSADYAAVLAVAVFSVAAGREDLVAAAGVAFQVLAVCGAWYWSGIRAGVEFPRRELRHSLSLAFAAAQKADRRLWMLSGLSWAQALPAAAAFSALPLFLGWSMGSVGEGARAAAVVIAIKSVCALGLSVWLARHLASRPEHAGMAAFCAGSWTLIACGVAAVMGGWIAATALMTLGVTGSAWAAWARTRRQEMLPADPGERLSLTGVLIATEASSYLFAAAAISMFGKSVALLLVFLTLPLMAIGSLWVWFAFDRCGPDRHSPRNAGMKG